MKGFSAMNNLLKAGLLAGALLFAASALATGGGASATPTVTGTIIAKATINSMPNLTVSFDPSATTQNTSTLNYSVNYAASVTLTSNLTTLTAPHNVWTVTALWADGSAISGSKTATIGANKTDLGIRVDVAPTANSYNDTYTTGNSFSMGTITVTFATIP